VDGVQAAQGTQTALTTPPHKWLIAAAVMLGCALEVLDSSIVNVSLPHMQGSFSASVDEITWVLTSYIVANSVMIPLTGWVSSRFGRKRYFLASVSAFVVASALCGGAQSIDQMVIFRLLQGAAGAAMIPSSQAILMETFPAEEQQLAMATWGIGLMVAPILGPTLGGWITDNWDWRWNFYINVPLGTLTFLMVSVFVYDPHYLQRRQTGSIDYLGIVFLVAWLGLLQIVLDRGQRADWFSSPWVVWMTVTSSLSMVLLIFRELCLKEPILDLHVFALPLFSTAVFLITVHSFMLFSTGVLIPVFLQEVMGYSAWKAGLTYCPRAIGGMCAMLFAGQVSRAGYDNKRLVGVGFAVVAAGLWMMGRWNLEVGMWQVLWAGFVLGLGFGMSFPILSAVGLSGVERARMGYAASLFGMLQQQGRAAGIAYTTNMLVSTQQIHQSRLVEHFSIFEAWKMSHMAAHVPGSPVFRYLPQIVTGRKQGLGIVYGLVQAQAAMLAFNDIYRLLTAIAVLMIPSFLILRARKPGTSHALAH
jgi:MFS transporter, DHA2 family, multidrug resistance protein